MQEQSDIVVKGRIEAPDKQRAALALAYDKHMQPSPGASHDPR